jgi:DNA-directed RNA polymerase specialized sigma24 family protein
LAGRELRQLARKLRGDLAPDLLEDAVAEVWLYLIRYFPRFDPSRGTARTFLRLLLKNALRKVRACYAHPNALWRPGPEPEALASLEESVARALPAPGGQTHIESHADANRLVSLAPIAVRRALLLVHVEGLTVTEAAEKLSLSRFTLARRLEAFSAKLAA